MRGLRKGKLVVIEDEPCKVTDIQFSKPGKHGSMKARVVAVSLSTGNKKNLLGGASTEVEVPKMIRKEAQVVAIMGDRAQLMDLQTYETYELEIPDELKGKIQQGGEVDIEECMSYKIISRVKS